MNRGRFIAALLISLTMSAVSGVLGAAEAALPSDLQSMKGELLNLNRDISQLENELLFPSTETAIVVSVEPGAGIKLVDMTVSIDDDKVGYHYYSPQEFAALTKGGMHRIYTGNIRSGSHMLKVMMSGYDKSGTEFQRTMTFAFTKNATRKVIEVKAADNPTSNQGELRFREWEIQ